jgi:hypothetical protein
VLRDRVEIHFNIRGLSVFAIAQHTFGTVKGALTGAAASARAERTTILSR